MRSRLVLTGVTATIAVGLATLVTGPTAVSAGAVRVAGNASLSSKPHGTRAQQAVVCGNRSQTRGNSAAQRGTGEAIAGGYSADPSLDLTYHGGKRIAELTFKNFYVGGQAAWQQADIQHIDGGMSAAMSDAGLNDIMAQYFDGQISARAVPSTVLPNPSPGRMDHDAVESLVKQLHDDGSLAGLPLDSTVVDLVLPAGVELVNGSSDSHTGLGGFHGSIHLAGLGGVTDTVYYAVVVYSTQGNGVQVFRQSWQNVVATFYHELNEARTDADVEDLNQTHDATFAGWVASDGDEVGDIPITEAVRSSRPLTTVFKEVPLSDGSGNVPVQLMYSNRVHGPEETSAPQSNRPSQTGPTRSGGA